ncbi:SgcJ/EcaC family oxidoreductase [Novosphingobium sp. 9U]|uniref:YybH family protein n=1 Tax=Novosphingobium sp. 9U TaxID=2653158 RepID=UPI0012F3D5EE|nr:SgcJ/EcaC family oxidoreductase [Novosphingobium sp. 9U]VWX52873.1 conserved hypothetical protein [Novosphingobium sp. 9U]
MTDFATAEARIRQLHALYTDAVWRKDAAAFAQCFTPDAEWRVDGSVLRGRDEIVREFERTLAGVKRVLVGYRTPYLELTGAERASGRTYVTEHYAWTLGPPTTTIARYYEYYVDGGDPWCISWRLHELLYSGPGDLTGEFYEGVGLPR